MDQIVRKIVRFERFELDLNRGCVLIDDRIVDLRPKTFEVLRHLAANPGHLVSKDDLYAAAWPDVIVGDDSLSQCIHELRQLLGDTDRRLIKTISRRGYLLNALPIVTSVAASPSIMADRLPTTADGPIKAASRNPSADMDGSRNLRVDRRRRRSSGVFLGAALWPASVPPAPTSAGTQRIALVMGNIRYRSPPRLDNPERDAEKVTSELEKRVSGSSR